MSEVETEVFRVDQGARLLGVFSQDLPQGQVDQMRGGMIAADGVAPFRVDFRCDLILRRKDAPDDLYRGERRCLSGGAARR